MKDPLRTLSRKVAASAENTPEMDAFREGRKVVPNTWGHYATKALDLGLSSPEDVCDLLAIDPEQLTDPSLKFEYNDAGHGYPVNFYVNYLRETYENRGEEMYEPEVERLQDMAKMIFSQWKIDSEERERLLTVEEGVGEEFMKVRPLDMSDEEYMGFLHHDLRCKAYESGYNAPLGEVVADFLRANVLNEGNESELAKAWVESVHGVVMSVMYDTSDHRLGSSRVDDIVIGAEQLREIQDGIASGGREAARRYAEEQVSRIMPVFLAPTREEIRLLSGNET